MQKLFLFSVIAAAAITTSCNNGNTNFSQEKKLPENVKHADYPISTFSTVNIDGVFDVFLIHSEKESVFAEMDTTLFKILAVKNSSDTLTVGLGDNKNVSTDARWKDITINYKNIKKLILEGATDVTFSDTLNTDTLYIKRGGVGKILISVNCKVLIAEIDGVGETIINGSAGYAVFITDFMGNTKAAGLKTDSCKVTIDGMNAKIEVWAVKQLSIEATNGAKVKYKGEPQIVGENIAEGKEFEKLK